MRHSCTQSPCVSITSCLGLRFNSKSNANCYYCDVMRILTKILEIVVCAPVLKECERKEIWWRTTMEYQSIDATRQYFCLTKQNEGAYNKNTRAIIKAKMFSSVEYSPFQFARKPFDERRINRFLFPERNVKKNIIKIM